MTGNDQIQTAPVWTEDFKHHLKNLTLERMRVALLLVVFAVALDGAVQSILKPELFYDLIWSRVTALVSSLALIGLSYRTVSNRMAFVLSLISILIIASDIESAVVASGGYHSPFQTGFTILLISVGLLFPFTLRQMGIACVLIWSVFLAPLLTNDQIIISDSSSFYLNLFFLICASAIALTASYLTHSLRQKEYYSRYALQEEQAKSERLLLNTLPEPIANRLKAGEETISDSFDEVTVLFADIVGFTPFSENLPPEKLLDLLNGLFSGFDKLLEKYDVEKIKTIGDAYMVVGGVPLKKENHAEAIAEMALDMVEVVTHFSKDSGKSLDIRIGINSGPAVAGVIGKKKFTYDLWGDTVNTASRMESHGEKGKIQVTEFTYNKLQHDFELAERGVINIKGKANMRTYYLEGRK